MKTCVACLNDSFEELIDFGVLPQSGKFLSESSQLYKTQQLAFEFCSNCALIRRKSLQDKSCNYTFVDRLTSRRLPDYALQIAELLYKKGVNKDAFIIEVGCNDGSFLGVLKNAGFTNLLGIEPSRTCAQISKSKGHSIENVHLDMGVALKLREKYNAASVVICRNTLEHVEDPVNFLLAMRTLLDKSGILFVETPDTVKIIRDLRAYELWDEHIFYFTVNNLKLLLNRAGFNIGAVSIRSHSCGEYILAWCNSALKVNQGSSHSALFSKDIVLCRSFAGRWNSLSRKYLNTAASLPHPVFCLGASHPQSNFLFFSGLARYVNFFIDDDQKKAGRFVPLFRPVPVITTNDFLCAYQKGALIHAAFGYDEWFNRIKAALSGKSLNVFEPFFD